MVSLLDTVLNRRFLVGQRSVQVVGVLPTCVLDQDALLGGQLVEHALTLSGRGRTPPTQLLTQVGVLGLSLGDLEVHIDVELF